MAQSTTDININCAQALSVFVNDITQALSAINSCHAGESAPTYNLEDGVIWLDTSDGDYVLKMYINGDWIIMLDRTGDEFATVGGNIIKGRLDANDAKHDGTSLSSPNFKQNLWKIEDIAVIATPTEIDYCQGLTNGVQAGIDQEETPYIHPTTPGWIHIPAGGSEGNILRYTGDGVAAWDEPTPAVASSSSVGQVELDNEEHSISPPAFYYTEDLYLELQADPAYYDPNAVANYDWGYFRYPASIPSGHFLFMPNIKVDVDEDLNIGRDGNPVDPSIYIDPEDVNLYASIELLAERASISGNQAQHRTYSSYARINVSPGCQATLISKYIPTE